MGALVFLVLNALVSIVLIFLSFAIDNEKNNRSDAVNPLVNSIIFLASIFGMMAITLGLCFWAPRPIFMFFGRITFMLMGWYSVGNCAYMLTYPNIEKKQSVRIIQWILNLIATWMMFKRGGLNSISIDYNSNFIISSGLVFSGTFGRRLSLTWFSMYMEVYIFVIPFVTTLMVLVRAENTRSKLERQNLHLLSMGILTSWILFRFIEFAATYQPMMRSFQLIGFLPCLLLFMNVQEKKEIWDSRRIIRFVFRFLIIYMLPALLDGIVYTILWKLFSHNAVIFYPIFLVVNIVLVIAWVILGRSVTKSEFMRDSRYAKDFENELTSINFQDDPKDIIEHFIDTFKRFVDVESVRIVVDSGNGYLESIFTEENEKLTMPVSNEAFDYLLNQKRLIVFKEKAATEYAFAAIRVPLKQIFEETKSDAFIILNEGRHIVSIIFLGKKRSDNIFNDYDFEVFSRLYSNFFVLGYYMKNILNEAVVGTVNREIRMSSQIITSIQENMDLIKTSKVDCGYRMVPAHNIGGEFVDLIRLTDQRH